MLVIAMFAASMTMADATPAATTAATAVVPAAAAPAADAKKAANKPHLICKSELVTGSLMPKKTCYTSDDYAQRQQEERLNLTRAQENRPLKTN